MKKTIIAVLAFAFAASLAMPAVAESTDSMTVETTEESTTFVTSDGVLSIELANDTWKEIEDSSKWVVLSDGDDVITIEHYSNGEKLPEMTVADDHYVNVYQAVVSTQNEVFIITGSVVDKEKIPEVTDMIMSAKVLKYDTKLAVHKDEASVSEFSVIPVDKTMYVTASGLNVRAGCSTNDQILATLGYGESVHVTGVVQRNEQDYGWYQISYGNANGYVSANFLSDSEPEKKQDPVGPSYTGNVKTVYDEFGETSTLYECTDGLWRDKAGTAYTRLSETEFQVYEGTKRVFTYNPAGGGGGGDTGVVTAYDEGGTAVTLYESTDGFWYDREGTAYVRHSDTDFQVYEGNKHLTVY